jgi:hypothetical protein
MKSIDPEYVNATVRTGSTQGGMMTRKLKTLGLALIAVLAVSAAVASAAHASKTNIHVAQAGATITGAGPPTGVATRFTVTDGAGKNINVICEETNTFKGSLAAGVTTSETLTLKAEYKRCVITGTESISLSIFLNGCAFLFHSNSATLTTASVDVECPAGEEITISNPFGCTIHVPAQTGLTTTTLVNTGSGETRDIDGTVNVSGITYKITAGCPKTTSNLTTSDGTYKEEVTLTAENGGGSVGIFAD